MNLNTIWMLDAHCDTLCMRELFNADMDFSIPSIMPTRDILSKIAYNFNEKVSPVTAFDTHVNFNRLSEGNVGTLFLNVGDCDLNRSSHMIDSLYKMASKHSDKIAVCLDSTQVKSAVDSGKTGIVMFTESMLLFRGDIDLLHEWHRLGLRGASLTHGDGTEGLDFFSKMILGEKGQEMRIHSTQITPSSSRYMITEERASLYKTEKGLTDFGKSALKEMAELGMVCDLSHANDTTFREALEFPGVKFCATHSNCASLCPHTRNLTDDMMKALAQRGGVMGLCFFGKFIDNNSPSLEKYISHILHALDTIGPDHIGIGSDFDGVSPGQFMAVPDPGKMNVLWEALKKTGIDDLTIRKIAHQNFLRLL